MVLCFGDFELDNDRYELRQDGECRELEPRVFDLLAYFASHPEQVFTRDELIDAVWKGRLVSDATVSTCIKNARKALGDNGATQNYIETVRGRGFRFAKPVSERVPPDHIATATSDRLATASNTGPSLLILPFRSVSDNPDTLRIAEGLTSALDTILTRIPLLRLSGRTTRNGNAAVAPGARSLYDELGVDFVIDASLQELENQVRITVHLIDAPTDLQLWAEQFSVPAAADDVIDKGVSAIIAKLEPQLLRAIYNTLRSSDGEPGARQLFLEAYSMLSLRGWHHDSFLVAAELLRRSRGLDPDFALAPSCLSLVMGLGERVGLISGGQRARDEAFEAAERSLQLDSLDSTVLGFSGCALADIGFPERGLRLLTNAVEINPANAQAWAALGAVCMLQGRLDEAVTHLHHGMNISPLDSRLSIWGAFLTLALMLSGEPEAAVQQGQLACQRDDRSYMPRVVLAGVHLVRAEHEVARQILTDAYRVKPDLSPFQISALLGHKLGDTLVKLGPPDSGAR